VRRVREAKSNKLTPTVRACIIIGRILSSKGKLAFSEDHAFRQTWLDVLMPEVRGEERERVTQVIDSALAVCC
jgi:hypothetical protein